MQLEFVQKFLFPSCAALENAEFEIIWPNYFEMSASVALLTRKIKYGRLLRGFVSVTDGGRILCATYTNSDLDKSYWEGFTQAHKVTNVFVWNIFVDILHGYAMKVVATLCTRIADCCDKLRRMSNDIREENAQWFLITVPTSQHNRLIYMCQNGNIEFRNIR